MCDSSILRALRHPPGNSIGSRSAARSRPQAASCFSPKKNES
jgi:hypothetical protein